MFEVGAERAGFGMSGVRAADGERGYLPSRQAAAVALAVLGAIVWAFESLSAWDRSTQPKFREGTYIQLGGVGLGSQQMLFVAMVSFGFVAALLLLGAVLMAPHYPSGRFLVASACVLVLLGQTVVLVLTLLPDDWLVYSPPSSIATSELLMLCPLITLWCVAKRTRALGN